MGLPKLASSGSSGSSGGGGALWSGGTPRQCTIYPHAFTSWQQPLELSPACPNEGWVRQVVRDIHELDPCLQSMDRAEIEVAFAIDTRGFVTIASALAPAPQHARRCVVSIVSTWEFASARKASEMLVIYKPRTVIVR